MTDAKRRANIIGWILLLLITALGAYLRFYDLDLKPLHHDEGVNAWLTDQLIEKGKYKYNPYYYHGPFLYFFTAPFMMIFGKTDLALRLPPAILGTLSIPLLAMVKDRVGWPGILFAALLLALSPVDVYFSRTAIHEIYNQTFNLTLVGGIALWWMKGKKWGLWLAALSLALLFSTKETTAITVVAMVPAAIFTWLFASAKHHFPGGEPVPENLVAAAPSWWRRNYQARWQPEISPNANAPEDRENDAPESVAAAADGAKAAKADGEAQDPSTPPMGSEMAAKKAALKNLPAPVAAAYERLYEAMQATREAAAEATIAHANAKAQAHAAGLEGPPALPSPYIDLGTPGHLRRRIPLVTLVITFLTELWKRDRQLLKMGLIIFAVVIFLLFSSFFTNLKGVGGFFEAFIGWGKTGVEGKGHEKVWSYFFEDVMQRYYQPVLYLGVVGLLVGSYFREAFSIFNLLWFVIATAIYSAIPYKTPWCVISFITPLFYGCAIAVSGIVKWAKTFEQPALKWSATVLPILLLSTPLYAFAQQSWRVNFDEYDVDNHSIIYVQNVREFMDLVHDLGQVLEVAEAKGQEPDVYMIRAHNPLRYYLLGLGKQTWNNGYNKSNDHKIKKADIVIAQRSQVKETKKVMALDKYVKRVYHERPGQKLEVFIKKPLWEQYLAAVKAGDALAPKKTAPSTSYSATRSRELKKERGK